MFSACLIAALRFNLLFSAVSDYRAECASNGHAYVLDTRDCDETGSCVIADEIPLSSGPVVSAFAGVPLCDEASCLVSLDH